MTIDDTLEPHIQNLLDLRGQESAITVARAAAEGALLRVLRDSLADGSISEVDLAEAYYATRGLVLKGFDGRWNQTLPVSVQQAYIGAAHRKRRQARAIPNGPNGSYVGTMPMAADAPIPLRGTSVVYVLYHLNQPVYVGSTADLQKRLGFHERWEKQFDYWMAIPCKSREAAYEMEERLLAEYMPPLNRRAGR